MISAAQAIFFWFILVIICPAPVLAQPGEKLDRPRRTGFSVAVSPFYQFDANMNDGGKMSVASYYFSASVSRQVNQDLKIALGLLYELDDYHFSGVQSFPITNPWDKVQRYGFSIPVIYSLSERWRLVVVPTAQFSGETDARWSSSLVYGGVVSISYNFGRKSYIGIGLGTFANIEKTSIFPFLAVNWQITDRLRLSNPLQTSPAGPAGLELTYALTPEWEIGIITAYRVHRFRLDKDGPNPNGVGEYTRLPILAKISYTYQPVTFNLYGGLSVANKIWLGHPDGDGLYQTRLDPAPLLGLNITARF